MLHSWQMKQEAFAHQLLIMTAMILKMAPRDDPEKLEPGLASLAADQLAEFMIASKLKLLYSNLGGDKPKSNAVLHLLACIAQRGPKLVIQLCKRLDFELPALHKVARAPRSALSSGVTLCRVSPVLGISQILDVSTSQMYGPQGLKK